MVERRSALKLDRSLRAKPSHVPDLEHSTVGRYLYVPRLFIYNESTSLFMPFIEEADNELAKWE